MKIARARASQIEADIALGQFDATLERYGKKQKGSQNASSKQYLTVLDIWKYYQEFRQRQGLAASTLDDTSKRMLYHLERMPNKSISRAKAIVEWILSNNEPKTSKWLLMYLSAAFKLAVTDGLINHNPFEGLAGKIKIRESHSKEIRFFSGHEVVVIREEFYRVLGKTPYALMVDWLFTTGCRTGEALALKWGDVNLDQNRITISRSINSRTGIEGSTKNRKIRTLPINERMGAILSTLGEISNSYIQKHSSDRIFQENGKPLSGKKLYRLWSGNGNGGKSGYGIVAKLEKEGSIRNALTQYCTRHTFASLALHSGLSVPDVAYILGDDSATVLEYYAGRNLDLSIPVF